MAAPIAPVIATSAPPLTPVIASSAPSLDYPSSGLNLTGNPLYISYDQYYDETKKKIESTYPQVTKKPAEAAKNANYDLKKPMAAAIYPDKLKGQVNGPYEVPALVKYPANAKPKAKLDYNEYEKADYRTNDFRLGDITPFNRIPALSRYNTVVSSVSKGLSSLYPGVKPQQQAYPGYPRN